MSWGKEVIIFFYSKPLLVVLDYRLLRAGVCLAEAASEPTCNVIPFR